jgi:Tol biopolymer transport system component
MTLPPTFTPTTTAIPTLTHTPTITQTPTITLTPSDTPTITLTPTVSNTPYPTVLPLPTVGLAGDKFKRQTIDSNVVAGIGNLWLTFVNTNDAAPTALPGTPAPPNNLETVYLVSPDGGTRYKVIDLPASTGQRVYWSPNGTYLAYFLEGGADTGLYVLDLKVGTGLRMFAVDNLSPRGVLSEPVWSPDSTQIAITLTTAYAVDIFGVGPGGTNFRNLTQSSSFDFWPAWSPDGQYLAFVSDRDKCPTWEPNAPGSCYRPDASTPDSGQLYVLDLTSGQVRRVSETWLSAPPQWVSRSQVAFVSSASGDSSGDSALWLIDVSGGAPVAISNAGATGTRILRDGWSSGGALVVYQEAAQETSVIMRDATGQEIARSTQFKFPRFAFTAAWSPDSKRVVLAGHNSQCPFGMIILDDQFQGVTRSPAPNPGVCDPMWSPDGLTIAFTGVKGTGSADGRFDVYLANAAGLNVRNLTGKLSGQIRLLGWVGLP